MFSTPKRRAFVLFLIGGLTFATIALSLTALDRIRDCTSPEGGCFHAQKVQREENVRVLRMTSIAANYCTLLEIGKPPPPAYNRIQRCVEDQLTKLGIEP